MEWLVLGKAVPDADRAGPDLARRTLRREGEELFLNPFDQRAVRIALDLRLPGERVTILSMGPPSASEALVDPLALGVDRAVLLSDAALAGSDTLATARALAASARRLAAPIVLTGRWSTDSETGQVPAQVAALLGRPFLASARRLERLDGGRMRVVSDTETGWVQQTAPLPLVVAVGEKIAALRKPTDAEKAGVDTGRIERWSLRETGLDPTAVGVAGSPTSVERVQEVAPRRSPRLFDGGSPADRVREALGFLAGRSATVADAPEPVRSLGAEVVFRVLVSGPTGGLDATGLATLGEIARQHPRARRDAIWLGATPTGAERSRIGAAGGGTVLHTPAAGRVGESEVATAIAARLGDAPTPDGMVFPATDFGRAVAGRLAATLGLGLTGDAIEIHAGSGGRLIGVKPAFGARFVAEVATRVAPALFTLRAGDVSDSALGAAATVRTLPVTLPPSPVVFENEGTEVESGFPDPAHARLVVGIGQGVGGPDGVATARRFAVGWGAAVGGSRKVVDAGWLPRQLQIGLTGRSVAPRLALLVASSARPNQVIGYRRAGTIVLVTNDAAAAAKADVDAAIIGDYVAILTELDRQGAAQLRSVSTGRP